MVLEPRIASSREVAANQEAEPNREVESTPAVAPASPAGRSTTIETVASPALVPAEFPAPSPVPPSAGYLLARSSFGTGRRAVSP